MSVSDREFVEDILSIHREWALEAHEQVIREAEQRIRELTVRKEALEMNLNARIQILEKQFANKIAEQERKFIADQEAMKKRFDDDTKALLAKHTEMMSQYMSI